MMMASVLKEGEVGSIDFDQWLAGHITNVDWHHPKKLAILLGERLAAAAAAAVARECE